MKMQIYNAKLNVSELCARVGRVCWGYVNGKCFVGMNESADWLHNQ